MYTRITQFLLVVVTLGVTLSVFSAPAQADPVASFSVSATTIVVGESVVATDTSSNPEGKELTYEWSSGPVGYPSDARSSGPECLNANCSQVRFTYSGVGEASVGLQVKWQGSPSGAGSTATQFIKVVEAGEAPAPIILNGPTTVSLPTVLDVMSPKPNMRSGCFQPALRGSEAEVCELYLIKRTGRDANGFFHYRWRFVIANPGTVEVNFRTWNTRRGADDSQTFSMNVVGNAFSFGDVRTCYWRTLKNQEGETKRKPNGLPVEHVRDLYFYSTLDVRVAVKLEVRKDGRWVTKRVDRRLFSSRKASTDGSVYSPWNRKLFRVRFGPPQKDQRVTYEVKKGRKLLKRGNLSKQACPLTWTVS